MERILIQTNTPIIITEDSMGRFESARINPETPGRIIWLTPSDRLEVRKKSKLFLYSPGVQKLVSTLYMN